MSNPPYNYGINAVPVSNTKNMFVPAVADNVPTVVQSTPVSFTVASQAPGANGVPLTAAVFAQGSGLYLINVNGNGNNDLQTFGYITITPAGSIGTCTGCFAQNVSPTGAVVGAVSTTPYQLIYLGANAIPTLFQNTGASITYAVSAAKIANF